MTRHSPQTPPDTCIYAIGDVHGRLDLLDRLLPQIAREAENNEGLRRVLVMLGDYVDRGPDSSGVVQRLDDMRGGRILHGFEVHLLIGNHEAMMLEFLEGRDGTEWLLNGGAQTIASYGLDPALEQGALRHELMDALTPAHLDILQSLEMTWVEGDYAFVHAGVRPGVAWDEQTPMDLLWIREEFLHSEANFGAFIVHGHAAGDGVEERANRINLDTRAWASGTLTCLVLHGCERRFLST